MGLEKVTFSPTFLDEMEHLVFVLYKENYFSYQSNAIFYVDAIFDFVKKSIHTFPHKSTPNPLLYRGSNYIFYKSNARTTWLILFKHFDEHYLITGILNNHCEEARFIGTN